MVPFPASFFSDMRQLSDLENSSDLKKRKVEEPLDDGEQTFVKRSKAERTKSVFDTDLHLESTPLPLGWQRCLDLQSGQIHFYNTRTRTRSCLDPRRSHAPPSTVHRSLDLELNLQCDSLRKINGTDHQLVSVSSMRGGSVDKQMHSSGGLMQKLSRLVAAAEEEERQEMVATVCRRCHMLVMLIKS